MLIDSTKARAIQTLIKQELFCIISSSLNLGPLILLISLMVKL